MGGRAEYLAWCRTELQQLEKELEPLASGKIQTFEKEPGETQYRETTQRWVSQIKRSIETYRQIIRSFEEDG